MNLLVCDLTAAVTAVTVVVPVTRTFSGAKADATVGPGLKTTTRTEPTGLSSKGSDLDAW